MLTYTGKDYKYSGNTYTSFWDALMAMMYDATWHKKVPRFGNIDVSKLHQSEKEQYLLIRAMFDWDIVAVLESDDYKAYRRATKRDIEGGKELLRMNPLWAKRHTMPATYPGNYAMQAAMLPMIDKVYGASGRSVYCANGKYPFKKVLSYIADKVLFNPETSPFDEVMSIYEVLDSNQYTKSLCEYIRNGDLPKARILAMQVDNNELMVDDFISIGSLRNARYDCKTKELWGDSSYMSTMLSLPPSMQTGDYYTWLANAGRAAGKDLGLDALRERKEVKLGDYGLDLQDYSMAEEQSVLTEDEPTQERYDAVRETVSKIIDDAVPVPEPENKPTFEEVLERILGFEPVKVDVSDEMKGRIIDGSMSPMDVRLWYVKATAPKKTVKEKLEAIFEGATISDEGIAQMPRNLIEELDSVEVPSVELEESILDWWSGQSIRSITPMSLEEKLLAIFEGSTADVTVVMKQLPDSIKEEIEAESEPSSDTVRDVLDWWVEQNKPEYGPMEEAAVQYCTAHGLSFVECYKILKSEGYSGESLYRALPGYVKAQGTVIVESTVTYLFVLSDTYGSTQVKYKGGN